MANQVFANMMEVSCKSGSGKTICAFPDVCFTPPLTPATPPGVPIPYPNTGMASDSTDGSTSVKISGKEVMLKNKSCFSKSTGDEAGAAPKKGVVTSKNTGKVYFNMWSMDVKVEGENVVRHLDITTHNHGSTPGNSPPMPHTDGAAPSGAGDEEGETCPICPGAGNPVNPILGAKVLAGDEDLDFAIDGPLGLDWQRTYMSTNPEEGWFGRGWRSPLEVSLEAVPTVDGRFVERLDYIDSFGRRVRFPLLEFGEQFFSSSEQLTLSRADSGRYRLESSEGVSYWFSERVGRFHRLVAITDRNDNKITIDRTGAFTGKALRLRSCAGREYEFGFQASRLTEIAELRWEGATLQRVVVMAYEYTAQGDLCRVVNRIGECVRAFEYNPDRLMTHQVYAGTFESWYEYVGADKSAKVVRHWDNAGGTWAFEYRPQETVVVDQDGRSTRYHFDDKKRWIGTTDPIGRFTYRALDRRGNLRAVIDAAEHVSESVFDERSRPVVLRDPCGATTAIEWHAAFDLPIAVTDPLGRVTCYEYDDRGNLVAEVDPAGARTTHSLNARGQVEEVEDANGGVKRMRYDAAGRVTHYTDCSSRTTAMSYDEDGRLATITNALGEETRFHYDAVGRLIRQTLADASFEQYEYDIAGRLTAITNGVGARTGYRYSPDGLLLERVDALGNCVRYRYDRARRLCELVNENGAAYQFSYDVVDRLIEEVRFDGVRTSYKYDQADYLVQVTEAAASPEAISTTFRRDAVGRVVQRATNDESSTWTYDIAGQVVGAHVAPADISVKIEYDPCGRVVREHSRSSSREHALKHSYDPLGNRIQTVLPDGTILGSLHYGSGHIHQIHFNGGAICDMERDALHREIRRSQGALSMSRSYDRAGHVSRQWSVGPADSLRAAPVVVDRQYRYDQIGRLVSTQQGGGPLAYDYDAIDRLTRFNEERFAFDPAHNLLPLAVPAGPSTGLVRDGRVQVFEDKRYAYDAHGRVVEKRIASHTLNQFSWNDSHQLVECRTEDRRGTRVCRYVYDPFGRRVCTQGPDGERWFVWDGDRLLKETDALRECTFVYEPDSFVPLAQVVKSCVRAEAPSATYHYHCDQVGLPRELTDASGARVWAAEYFAWGRLKTTSGGSGEPIAADMRPTDTLRLQGQQADADSGLHYNRFRYYDPDIGRFVSADPIGLLGGENLYALAPNPVEWVDPLGLAPSAAFVRLSRMAEKTLDFSTSKNGAVFWSGEKNMLIAQAWAKCRGKTTLEQTQGGEQLDKMDLFNPKSGLKPGEAAKIWDIASKRFAQGASGAVNVFSTGSAKMGKYGMRTWWRIEKPELLANKKVTGITRRKKDGGKCG